MANTSAVPVVIFVYKRVDTLEMLISSLLSNEESSTTDLIIFSDGPKNIGEVSKVQDVRNFAKSIKGFHSVKLQSREENLGLAGSFLTGVSEIFTTFDKAIFLEDDNLVSSSFLAFMNSALRRYELTNNVGCVTGFSFPITRLQQKPYFLLGAETWSFGTWKRVWDDFEMDSIKLKTMIEQTNKQKKLDMYGFKFYEMLEMQIRGEIDSWGVRWWANAVLKDLLCLYPSSPFCINTGWGPKGTHIQSKSKMHSDISKLQVGRDFKWPSKVHASSLMGLNLKSFNSLVSMKSLLYQIGLSLRRKGL